MSVCFSFKGPVSALLPEEQVLLGQLQGELGHLQAGLLQLGVDAALIGAQLPEFPAQTLSYTFAGFQTPLQAAHLQQSSFVLILETDKRVLESLTGLSNMCLTRRWDHLQCLPLLLIVFHLTGQFFQSLLQPETQKCS